MRVVIQRVKHAQVAINGNIHSQIKTGLLVLLGITHDDNEADADWLVQKICKMRIFDDESGAMNRSVVDIEGEVLVVSQFTLMAATQKATARATSAQRVPNTPNPSTSISSPNSTKVSTTQ